MHFVVWRQRHRKGDRYVPQVTALQCWRQAKSWTGNQQVTVEDLKTTPPLTGCPTLRRFLTFSEPGFPHPRVQARVTPAFALSLVRLHMWKCLSDSRHLIHILLSLWIPVCFTVVENNACPSDGHDLRPCPLISCRDLGMHWPVWALFPICKFWEMTSMPSHSWKQ